MRTIRSLAGVLGLASVCLWGLSCKKNAPTTAAQAAPPVKAAPEKAVVPPRAPDTAHDAQADVMSQDLATLNRKGYLQDAYFNFDESELRDDARQALANDAQWLKKYPSIRILLEGHCDDRGTEAYNLALGEQRASIARQYLADLGVPADRVAVVSYGKERPFCEADNDSCWQENRRDHVLVTAK
ncbi:MAG TPA: peptidoglycan-associated lipoprotein Pal [Thermoanaerobaculia bacterium]|nr:peptidoglycan-associated lipoprotein Pal [Thermoanaerobaculia bacterium]